MPSETDICNRALSRVGEARITSLTDDTKQARACNSAYAHVRDEVLRSHPWYSAITRTTLAKLSSSPAYGYDDQYQLPSDCLRVVELYDTRLPWVVEGRKLLSDEGSPLSVRYVRREEDPNQYDSMLVSAIAARLAIELCEELSPLSTSAVRVVAEDVQLLARARVAGALVLDAMPLEDGDWI